ncbi:MAG: adenosine deaminase [Eubacteriales bacterium]|nr:adenosine deaminase [Eubacteriales bacterium]
METFQDLKKIDLHCHLDGSLSEETIRRLAGNVGVELPGKEALLEQLQAGEKCENLERYLGCFKWPLELLHTKENLEEAVKSVLADAAKENVVYMEIRFAPLSSVGKGLTCRQVIESAVKGLREGEKLSGVRGNLILCGMRHVPAEENMEILREGRAFLGNGVCAADMAGNEAAFPIRGQAAFFEEAKRLGIPFTIHAGECGEAGSVRDAIALGAARIGHGIAAWKDAGLMEQCAKSRIPLEMCPISNLQTKAVASAEEYPFRKFYDAGLRITVNTDNRMVSNTTLTKEFQWLAKHYGITREDARELTRNAAEAAFVGEDVKRELLKMV